MAVLAELSGSRAGCVTSPLRLLHYGFPSHRSTCTHSPIRGSCTTFPCRLLLAQGSCATLASLSQAGCVAFPPGSALLPGVPGFQPHGFLFRATRCFLGLCRATSDRLLRPDVPHHIPGAPSNMAGPVVLRRVSFLEAVVLMLTHRAIGPSCCTDPVVHHFLGVPSPRTAAPCHLKGAFRTTLPQTLRAIRKPQQMAFLLWLSRLPLSWGICELMLIPGSAAQLLNHLVSKPWETGRLSLAGSTYFVTLLLYLTYYNLYQIALCC